MPESDTEIPSRITFDPQHSEDGPPRRCPAPADFRAEVESYDRLAEVGIWDGPHYRMTYRILGQGPPLVLVPGIASTYRGYTLTLNRLSERFRTITYDYPGEHPDDGARLRKIKHNDLAADVGGLLDHLGLGRAFLFGLSFGSTVVLKAIHDDPRRFPKAVVQGAFARRTFTGAERLALKFGRLMPGTSARLPLRETILAYNNKMHFPREIEDRWPFYVEQNGLTPIGPLAARLDLLSKLDLRPLLREVRVETLVLQGNEDRIVSRKYFEELCDSLPNSRGVIMPMVGHQPHYTHAEGLAQAVTEWCLPCAPGGCPSEAQGSGSP